MNKNERICIQHASQEQSRALTGICVVYDLAQIFLVTGGGREDSGCVLWLLIEDRRNAALSRALLLEEGRGEAQHFLLLLRGVERRGERRSSVNEAAGRQQDENEWEQTASLKIDTDTVNL